MIEQSIQELIQYGIEKELITSEDEIFLRNQLMDLLQLSAWETPVLPEVLPTIDEILDKLVSYAAEKGIITDSNAARDLFDTRIMGLLTERPHTVNRSFFAAYHRSPEEATDWYYQYSKDTNYVRAGRIAKDLRWTYDCEYGTLDVTINRSKPEKDPKQIALAKKLAPSGYPLCQLCMENEGYYGRVDHPARTNHRIVRFNLGEEVWGFQYSPYAYFNEHCIFLDGKHEPMVISKETFSNLLEIVEKFPGYFAGSNADLPIVGGSILTHEHYQGGRHVFAMEEAPVEKSFRFAGFENVSAGIVKWPMSVIRLNGSDKAELVALSAKILDSWRKYSDEKVNVKAFDGDVLHHTITPIARMKNGNYELDLVLRDNQTSEEYPDGIFHPHKDVQHIKKENIGLIEVMGLAILPPRLKDELAEVGKHILGTSNEMKEYHRVWADEIKQNHPEATAENITEIVNQETGKVFARVLEDAGVYKRNKQGQEAFMRFVENVGLE